MKKITLLTLLMWSSLFYGQEYLNEDFEGSFLPTGWADVAGSGDTNNYPWASQGAFIANGKDFEPIGTKSAFYNELFNLSHGEGTGEGTVASPCPCPVAKDKWLVTPAMNFTSATNPELVYYETMRFPDFAATTGVYYSTDYSGDPNTATWTAINTVFGFGGGDQFIWKQRGAFDLSAANGNSSVYIGFRYQGTNNSEWMLDNILVREAPSCIEPSIIASFDNITTNSADFNFSSGNGGTETLWDVELIDITGGETQGTGTTTSTSSNPHSFTSLASGNSYEVYVRADCGGGDKSSWVGPFAFNTADSNDECSSAKVVVQDIETATAASANIISGSINGATDSGITDNCSGGDPNDDVWFSFVARTDGVNITIDTPFDGVIELFSTTDDTCGTLTYDSCADNALPGVEEISATGLSAGDTYFVRVYQWETAAPADGNFTIKIWSSQSLSNDDIEDDLAEFKLYPNPVQDKLNLRAQDNIENISIYNMLGQEVLRQAPNKNSSEVDMSALQTGSYFVKVTINGLTETKQIIKR